MGFSELLNDKDRYDLYVTVATFAIFAVILLYRIFMKAVDGSVAASGVAKVFFTQVGDEAQSQPQISPGERTFLSVLSIVSLFTALGGFLLGIVTLAFAATGSAYKLLGAGAVGLMAAGVFGIYYSGKRRRWPG